MFIKALFTITRTCKQPRCLLANEYIRKLLYIYTMGYYTAIKKNTFKSVLMRWMKLEPIIQSEVSQKEKHQYSISSVQFSSVTQSCPTPYITMNRSTPGLPVHHQLPESPKPISIESVMSSNHLIFCRPLLLLPSIFPRTGIFSSESALCIRWPKYWSFSFNISPSNEHPGLILFHSPLSLSS